MQGTVSIKGLEFQACHGATAAERRTPRRFQVDASLTLDISKAVHSDRLADAVDYQLLSELLLQVATGKTYHLLEALAGAMVLSVAEKWPDAAIFLELRKLCPPCAGNPSHSSVSLNHNKSH